MKGSAYLLLILTLCYTLSFIDRQILSLLVGPIKADLGISDTQVGLLGGLAFSLFYTFYYTRRQTLFLIVIFYKGDF